VLYYYWPDGTCGTELYFIDGSFDWAYGTYSISNDQTTLTTSSTLNSTLQTITASINITKFEVDNAEFYSYNFLDNGPYTLKVSKVACQPLSTWK
jgi:hypothetical protein